MKNSVHTVPFFLAAILIVSLLSACSSSPMKARLGKNFIYNCSLELIDKGIAPGEANRICVSSHEGEMAEKDRKQKPAQLSAPPAAVPEEVATTPAVNPMPAEQRTPAAEYPSLELEE